jgi:hypothetical protein
MNSRQTIRSWLTTRLFLPIILSIGSFSVQAIPLSIDTELSQITYTPSPFGTCIPTITSGSSSGLSACPPSPGPEVFKVSGAIELGIRLPYLDIRSDQLLTDANSKGFLLGQPFAVETGLLRGISFETFDNPCISFIGPGSCVSLVRLPAIDSTGTWDGQVFTWNGTQTGFDGTLFTFSILATSSSVPVPSTLLLLVLTLVLTQIGSGRRKFRGYCNR